MMVRRIGFEISQIKIKMSKISIEEVEEALFKQNIDSAIVTKVIKELGEIAEEKKAERPALPKQKNEFLIVLSDPENALAGKDFAGWVVQIPVGDDPGLVLGKIRDAAKETDAAKKRKKSVISTMGEAFLGIKRKFIKSKNVHIKTKIPVRVLVTDNKL